LKGGCEVLRKNSPDGGCAGPPIHSEFITSVRLLTVEPWSSGEGLATSGRSWRLDEERYERAIPTTWIGAEELPVLFVNSFVGQIHPQEGAFYLTIGQTVPPALVGTPQEQAEQLEQIAYVPVKPVARLALTRSRMEELVTILQMNLENYDQIRQQLTEGDGA
jgi:hypothetical protein